MWQDDRKGLVHALLTAPDHVTEAFVEIHGDYVFGPSLTPVIDHHTTTNAIATLLVEEMSREDSTEFGVHEFDERQVGGSRRKIR